MLSSHLEKTLRDAYNLAYTNEHEFVTLEHLLFVLTDDKDALSVLKACGVNLSKLRKQLEQFIAKDLAKVEPTSKPPIRPGPQVAQNKSISEISFLASLKASLEIF